MSIESNNNSNNSFANDISEISLDMSNKSIKKNDLDSDSELSIYLEIFKNKNCPYLKTENFPQIPKIELLNEHSMKFNNIEKDINTYLQEINKNKYDFNYNKCQICHEKNNKYFCEKCSKNICEECSKKDDKECDKHHLSKLKEQKQLINSIKKKINNIIRKFILETNKDDLNVENNTSIEINPINYGITITPNQLDEIKNHFVVFNQDIELAVNIIEADYKNYFHYENIKRLYNYFTNNYEDISNNRCYRLIIKNENSQKEHNEKYDEKIIEDNIYILSLVINNKKSPIKSEIKLDSDNFQLLIVQLFDDIPVKDLFLLFKFFIETKASYRYSLEKPLNRPKIKLSIFNLNSIIEKILKDNINNKKSDKIYYGNDKKPVKNGLGMLYYANGSTAFKGQIEHCVRNGKGILYYENGLKAFEGNWENNKAEGYGIFYFEIGDFKVRYEGNWKNNAAEGQGKIFLYDNLYYKGYFIKGRMEGEGMMHFESKDEYEHYEGQFENCFWHGKGTRYYKNNNIMYHGEYKYGKENGNGKYINDKNGEYYIGEFKDGKPSGNGTWYNSDGTIKKL